MDWNLAIEKNTEALRRILAMLVALVASENGSAGGQFTFFPQKGGDAAQLALAEKSKLCPALTLPRHVHRFVLRLLRPAESATRRLIIIAARGLVVKVRPWRPRKQLLKKSPLNRKNGYGTGILIRPGPLPEWAKALVPQRSQNLSLPLLDPLPRYGARRRYVPAAAAPRIALLGGDPVVPFFRRPAHALPPAPTPDDPLDATRIHGRLAAIGRALDDLPGHAQRLARWVARRDARHAREREGDGATPFSVAAPSALSSVQGPGQRRARLDAAAQTAAPTKRRFHRLSPMRPGRPPGFRKRPKHEVHLVLNELHGLAVWARDGP